ncbi:NAD(P)H-binding protein [Nocardia sp. NPDC055029]
MGCGGDDPFAVPLGGSGAISLHGYTGQIGHQVLDRLVHDGQPVRVIARDPARLNPRIRERIEVVQGSHSDPEVLAAAFAGADSLLWLVPPNPRAADIHDHYLDFTRPAAEAIKTRGVTRVVGVTSLGRAYGKPAGLLSPAFAMDEMIEGTGVSYRAPTSFRQWCLEVLKPAVLT